MISFIYNFLKAMNTRLGERDDLFLLEACSIFDPASRVQKTPRRKEYMDRLLRAFPHDNPIDLHTASVTWMMQSSYDHEAGIVNHYAALAKGKSAVMKMLGLWGLNVLKNLPSNALVESRFSTAAQTKSSYRMNMSGARLGGTIMMRDEQPFKEVQFPEWQTGWARITA